MNNPVTLDHSSYIFGENLKEYLKGNLELLFIPNGPNNKNVGTIQLQTEGGVKFLFKIGHALRSKFEQVAKDLGMESKKDTENCYEGTFE